MATTEPQGRFTRVVGRLTLVNLGVLALGLISGPLQAQALGPVGRGELAAIVVPLTLAPLLLGIGIDGYVARAAASRSHPIGLVVGSGLVVTVVVSLAGVALAYPVAELLGRDRPTVELFLLIGFLLLPLSAVATVLGGVAWGRQTWRVWVTVRVVPPLSFTAAIVVLYVADDLTVASAAVSFLGSSVLGVLALWPVLRTTWPWSSSRDTSRTALSFGLKTWALNVVRSANVRLDQLLMAGLVPARELGLYAVAVTLAGYSSSAVGALGTALYPRIAEGERHLLARASRMTLLAIAVASALLAAVAPALITVLFGSDFSDAVPMAWLLLVSGVFLAGMSVLAAGVAGDGDPGGVARAEGVALVLSIPVLVVLLPSTGGVGAAAISIATYGLSFGLLLRRARRRFGGRLRDYLWPTGEDLRWTYAVLGRAVRRLRHRSTANR